MRSWSSRRAPCHAGEQHAGGGLVARHDFVHLHVFGAPAEKRLLDQRVSGQAIAVAGNHDVDAGVPFARARDAIPVVRPHDRPRPCTVHGIEQRPQRRQVGQTAGAQGSLRHHRQPARVVQGYAPLDIPLAGYKTEARVEIRDPVQAGDAHPPCGAAQRAANQAVHVSAAAVLRRRADHGVALHRQRQRAETHVHAEQRQRTDRLLGIVRPQRATPRRETAPRHYPFLGVAQPTVPRLLYQALGLFRLLFHPPGSWQERPRLSMRRPRNPRRPPLTATAAIAEDGSPKAQSSP